MIFRQRTRWSIDQHIPLCVLAVVVVVLLSLCGAPLSADTFLLVRGGKLEGELLNPDETPRVAYAIKTATGIEVTLAADLVKQFIPGTAEQKRYRELLARMPATAEGNWKMSQWCSQNKLSDLASFHAQQVLQIEPNHEEARRALGFRHIEGRWVQPDDLMRERGFVRHEGKWRLPQDIELEQAREKAELAEKEWRRKLKSWRTVIGRGRKEKEEQALEGFRTLSDPAAAVPLAELVEEEKDLELCRVYIDALGRLSSGAATKTLIHLAINHREQVVRDAALEPLARTSPKAATQIFRQALSSANRRHVLNAAVGIQHMGSVEAIPDLIEALITTHKVQVTTASPGQIGASFGNDGAGGLSVGSKPKFVEQPVKNSEVLDALTALAGNDVNFLYDEAAWKAWYNKQVALPPQVSLRRSP